MRMMESKNIELSARFKDDDGDSGWGTNPPPITVEAGRFEWQIVWGWGGGLTHAKTDKESPKENLEAGIAYLKEKCGNITRIDSDDDTRREAVKESKPSCCGEICGDNREQVIEAAKSHLLNATNIETSPDEMKCLDAFLFRCWQQGWLRDFDDTKPKYETMQTALWKVKDAFESNVIYAPGASPTYGQADNVRVVYKTVCDALNGRETIAKGNLL